MTLPSTVTHIAQIPFDPLVLRTAFDWAITLRCLLDISGSGHNPVENEPVNKLIRTVIEVSWSHRHYERINLCQLLFWIAYSKCSVPTTSPGRIPERTGRIIRYV